VTDSVALLTPPLAETWTFTDVFAETTFVAIGKLALVLPAGTVTLAGTPATADPPLMTDTATVRSLTGAQSTSTVAIVVAPPPWPG
jgi:hypothetical protein